MKVYKRLIDESSKGMKKIYEQNGKFEKEFESDYVRIKIRSCDFDLRYAVLYEVRRYRGEFYERIYA